MALTIRLGQGLLTGVAATMARREGLATLLGYATGVTVGLAGALVLGGRPAGKRSVLSRALLFGGSAMLVANAPLTLQGLTDPRRWGVEGWLEDLVPHAAYGLAAAAGLEVLNRARSLAGRC